jgi:hypothetical protein
MTQKQKNELTRAMEIAQEKGHKVFTGKSRQTGETVYTVRSASVKNLFHVLYIAGGRIICDCKCHRDGHICSHAAAVRLFLIEQRESLAAIEQREREDTAEPVIAQTEAQCLVELLDRDTTGDEWEEDERPEAEKQADAERRAEAMRRETQAEIEREAARKRETALPYDHAGEGFSIFKPERPGFNAEALTLNQAILPTLETPAAIAQVSLAIAEAQPGILRTEIAYGPEYNQQLEAFAGVPLRSLRNFANNVYVPPTYSAYAYGDGRVLVRLYKIATDMLYLLPDYAAFRRFEDDFFAYDPEDTRVRYNGRHAGRIER